MNLATVVDIYDIYAGGPGSGCRGSNCGRPALHNYREGSGITRAFNLLQSGRSVRLAQFQRQFGARSYELLRTLRTHGMRSGNWSLKVEGNTVKMTVKKDGDSRPARSQQHYDLKIPEPRKEFSRGKVGSLSTKNTATDFGKSVRRQPGDMTWEYRQDQDDAIDRGLHRAKVEMDAEDVSKFERQFKMSPMDLRDAIIKGLPADLAKNTKVEITEGWHSGSWSIDVNNSAFNMTRDIDMSSKSVDHSYWSMKPQYQGTDIGKQMFSNMLSIYDHLGLKSIKVDAGLNLGGYAWARYGFTPSRNDWDFLSRSLKSSMDSWRIDSDLKAKISGVLSMKDPKAIWILASMHDKVPAMPDSHQYGIKGDLTAGKAMLAGRSWFGQLSLNDKQQYSTLKSYLTGGKKKIRAAAVKSNKSDAFEGLDDQFANDKSDLLAVHFAIESGWSLKDAAQYLVGNQDIRNRMLEMCA